MKTNLLVHLVPTLPPHTGEAGEYALNLARQLRDHCGITSRFILCDPDWNGAARIEDFIIRRLRFPNGARLWAMLKDTPAVLLHYDGGGYQKNGLPNWLPLGIKSWLADWDCGSAPCPKQLFTVFHELWGAPAKPWRPGFCLHILQRRLVGKLHRQSRVSITATRLGQSQLDAIEPGKTLFLPVPSSLPVLNRNRPGAARNLPLSVAIIARPGSQSATIRAHANLLRTFDKTNRLAEVMLLGGPGQAAGSLYEQVALLQQSVSPWRIRVYENMKPGDVSLLLNRADLFLSPLGGADACKSGPLMSALAAGCATVLSDGRNAAPLQEGVHFVASDDTPSGVERFGRMAAAGGLQGIASAGRTWYQQYADWKVIAQKYQLALRPPMPVAPAQEPLLAPPLWSLPAPAADVRHLSIATACQTR